MILCTKKIDVLRPPGLGVIMRIEESVVGELQRGEIVCLWTANVHLGRWKCVKISHMTGKPWSEVLCPISLNGYYRGHSFLEAEHFVMTSQLKTGKCQIYTKDTKYLYIF